MKYFLIICGILINILIVPIPVELSIIIRSIITLTSIILFYKLWDTEFNIWITLFFIIIFLCNPLIPIEIYSIDDWMYINVSIAILFFIKAFDKKPYKRNLFGNKFENFINIRIINMYKNSFNSINQNFKIMSILKQFLFNNKMDKYLNELLSILDKIEVDDLVLFYFCPELKFESFDTRDELYSKLKYLWSDFTQNQKQILIINAKIAIADIYNDEVSKKKLCDIKLLLMH